MERVNNTSLKKHQDPMVQIRVGLVGYGSWTTGAYLPALNQDGRARILSVAARSEQTRARIEEDLGADVRTFATIDSLLQGPALDALMIAVPDSIHEQTLLAALDSGVAVLYEPPVTDTRRRIIPVLLRLLVAPQVTFADLELGLIPAVTRACELVRRDTIGKIQTVRIRLQSGWGPVANYDLCNFNHLCTWYVDVLNRLLGSTPERVLLLDGFGTPGRRQNQSVGHLEYAGGIWGTLQANISSVGELEIGVEINGQDGDIKIDMLTGDIRHRTRASPVWSTEQWPALSPHARWPGMHESIAMFLDAVQSGKSVTNDALTVAALQLVGLAAEESRDSGTWAEVSDVGRLDNGT